MKLKGILLYFLYCRPQCQREFNYWYDTDHVPENRALPGIFNAQRYVATPDLVALRMKSDLEENGGSYLTAYFTEKDVMETRESMSVLSKRLREENRFPDYFHSVFGGAFSMDASALRRDFPIEPGAMPVQPHRGIYITLDELLDNTQERKLLDQYDKSEVPVILKCPGVAAAFRFRCLERRYINRILHFFFLDDDPAPAAEEIRRRLTEQGTPEEVPGLSGVTRRIFAGPYMTIIPLQHDFLALGERKKQR